MAVDLVRETTTPDGAPFDRAATRDLFVPPLLPAIQQAATRAHHHKADAMALVPFQQWRAAAQRIKEYTIRHLDRMLVEFERAVTARGGVVLWASSPAQANDQIVQIARAHGVELVVKSKSMATEELGLNAALGAAGITSLETDLGEYIIQLAHQRPSHLVAPALHLTRQEIGRIFADTIDAPYTDDPTALSLMARERLRARYLEAGMGITGVNFAVAETGSIVVVENEGNAGLSIATPPVHLAVMGIEKLIPRMADLPLFLNLLARSSTGQQLTSYTHVVLGPREGRKFYVVLLDHGRTEILADPATRQSLHCIRCGACLNACPVYRRAGGWAYGWVYPGPIGAVVTPPIVGLDQAGMLPFASSLCGACQETCPINIDLPHQLVYLRYKAMEGSTAPRPLGQGLGFKLWSWAMSGPDAYRLLMAAARLGMRLLALLRVRPDRIPGPLGAWARTRAIPAMADQTFKQWYRSHPR